MNADYGQTELGLNLYDFHARQFDPALGRWLAADPQNQFMSPYLGMGNMPTVSIDPDGELAWFVPVISGAILGGTTGGIVAANNGQDWWKGVISGAFIGAAAGAVFSAAIGAQGITTLNAAGETILTKGWGITTSALNGGVLNMATNGGEGWKSALVGSFSSAFSITGGFGIAKKSLFSKLAYQGISTSSRSIGNNWARGEDPLGKWTLGVGPVNFTLGKGQQLLQLSNNIGNVASNGFGLINDLFFGGSTEFDWKNLTAIYRGGLIEKFGGSFGAHSPMLKSEQEFSPSAYYDENLYQHELHHVWQSRALGDSFLPNYLANALPGFVMPLGEYSNGLGKHPFFTKMARRAILSLSERNYFETIGYSLSWLR